MSAWLIQGRVLLDDRSIQEVIPGDYVMVYVPSLGIGTLSDEQGNYSLSIPDPLIQKSAQTNATKETRQNPSQDPAQAAAKAQSLEIEFSRIGYGTVSRRCEISGAEDTGHGAGAIGLGTITLEPQTLMITAAMATPDGMSPAEFVLNKVIKKTKATKGNRLSYEADINYDFATHEIPLMASALSGGQLGMTKFAGSLMGIGPLVKYCLANDDISVQASLHRSVVKGKAKDSDGRIVKSKPSPLPAKVQQNILDFFGKIDLFDLLYGAGGDMGKSFAGKHEFQMEGSYEYGDKLVYVLSCKAHHMGVKLHIVDDEWAILKMQVVRDKAEVLRVEARDMGGGIYMPATFVMNPSLTLIRNEQIPELIRMIQENKQLKKAGKARMIAILEERHRNKEDFNPYIACGFSVRYIR